MHKLKNVARVHTHTSRNLKEEKRVVKDYSKNNGNKSLLSKFKSLLLVKAYFAF